MLESLFTNVFGRPKNKSSNRGNPQNEPSSGNPAGPNAQMTGPFSASVPQMPQPTNLPYPIAPYPAGSGSDQAPAHYYPPLPFSQPPSLPHAYQPQNYPTGTLAAQVSPLDSVPFEANYTNLTGLSKIFTEIKQAADVVDRADSYLKSSQSDYDFKTEQGLIYQ